MNITTCFGTDPAVGLTCSTFGSSALESGKSAMMAEAFFRQKEWDHAEAHFRSAARPGTDDDIERCRWFARHAELPFP